MIYGIGIDVLQVDRIARVFDKHGERFVSHLLMPEERAQLARTARPVRFLAMRFAAKEAIVKGMGTGFAHGVWIRGVSLKSCIPRAARRCETVSASAKAT